MKTQIYGRHFRALCASLIVLIPGMSNSASAVELPEIADDTAREAQANVRMVSTGKFRGIDLQVNLVPARYRAPGLHPRLVSFIEECTDLEAIPLFDINTDSNKRVFVGVNFDGIFGIHGRL